VNDSERIADLERRLADAEARISLRERRGEWWVEENGRLVPLNQPRGCVCPPGAEIGCQSTGCPRRGIGGIPVTCGGAS